MMKSSIELKPARAISRPSSLTLSGFAIPLTCLIPVTSVEEVINTSFTLSPSTKYGPYDVGTTYHSRIPFKMLSKSVLKGEGIFLTVYGYNVKDLENSYVKERYSFIVDPADDLYTFTLTVLKGIVRA